MWNTLSIYYLFHHHQELRIINLISWVSKDQIAKIWLTTRYPLVHFVLWLYQTLIWYDIYFDSISHVYPTEIASNVIFTKGRSSPIGNSYSSLAFKSFFGLTFPVNGILKCICYVLVISLHSVTYNSITVLQLPLSTSTSARTFPNGNNFFVVV